MKTTGTDLFLEPALNILVSESYTTIVKYSQNILKSFYLCTLA